MSMTGLTAKEIAKKLGISTHATLVRLKKAEVLPLTREALYPENAPDLIREVSKGGRPKISNKK
jgi:predicted ArsR family transcriptional regulator